MVRDLHIQPNMFYLLLTDFELFMRIYTGSCHPMMYRIHGYKSYDGSRQVLLDTYIELFIAHYENREALVMSRLFNS